MPHTRYAFGPVPSRRLGRSLGVDLVPPKTCTFDCVYCQLGRTTDLTVERACRAPVDDVLADVARRLAAEPDYLTVSGSGEPTLHSEVGAVIRGLHELSDVPVAVLTNGSLLYLPEVRRALRAADRVIPSLDVPDEALFRAVNRPHPALTFDGLVEGLVRFRDEYDGVLALEVLLLGGVTDSVDVVTRLVPLVERLAPDVVQLGTVIRPPAEAGVRAVSPEVLHERAALLPGVVEVTVDVAPPPVDAPLAAAAADAVELVARRPCTVDDVAAGLGIHPGEALKLLRALSLEGRVETRREGQRTYYVAARTDEKTGGTVS
ncbi:MAG: radical SAM protein [Thermoleophilia bacterium]|nr:radical SAM protein [Thermoleophilia bacterium]